MAAFIAFLDEELNNRNWEPEYVAILKERVDYAYREFGRLARRLNYADPTLADIYDQFGETGEFGSVIGLLRDMRQKHRVAMHFINASEAQSVLAKFKQNDIL